MAKKRTSPKMPKPQPPVAVRNRLTRAPVTFKVPGRSVRLAPGEAIELSEACVETAELRRLLAKGDLAVGPTAKAASAAASATPAASPTSRGAGKKKALKKAAATTRGRTTRKRAKKAAPKSRKRSRRGAGS